MFKDKEEIKKSIALIKEVGEEIIGEDELEALLSSAQDLITYDGFEPSGQMHIAQGIQRAINVNRMIQAGFTFKMLVADWFGFLNNKMGGDIDKIRTVGEYFIELWRASGMNLDGVEFIWTSDMIKDSVYWEMVMKVAKANSLKRILKTTQIMGKSENDDLSAAQIFYPCMQTADVFRLGAQVTQLGMDQRKVNMIAREVGKELGFTKPIIVSHHMLQGLGVPKDENIVETKEINTSVENVFKIEDYSFKISPHSKDLYEININIEYLPTHKIENLLIVLSKALYDSNSKVVRNINEEYLLNLDLLNLEKKLGVEIVGLSEVSIGIIKLTLSVPKNLNDRVISMKMSKSIPDSAIFMTDTKQNIERKIKKAYAPEGIIKENPILEYCKYLIFPSYHLKGQEGLLKDGFLVKRLAKFGGDIIYKSYEELELSYSKKELFPLDLKNAVINYIDLLLEPVRNHFSNNIKAKELFEKVQSYTITR